MLTELTPLFKKPPLYTKTEIPFWDNEHISLQMLNAHLNPTYDGASRKLEFIEKSVDWISKILPSEHYPSVLDIGCGPGLYTERYAKKGYRVVGVDFSHRSINYAQMNAKRKGLPIGYFYQDYLKLSLDKEFDFVTMIYCDFGALSTNDRKQLLKIIYQHLKPGGRFLLDVFSLTQLENFQESQTWEVCPDGGFWCPENHITLNRACKYPDNVTLRQTLVIAKKKVSNYYLWDTYFSKKALEEEAVGSGFKICEYFGDVSGSTYSEHSSTLAVLLKK